MLLAEFGEAAAMMQLPNECTDLADLAEINFTPDELDAVTAAIRRVLEADRFPHAPRLDPLRAASGKFEAAAEPTPDPKGAADGEGDKRTGR
jgi:hypothetical protein